MSGLTRWDYIGIGPYPCEECGFYFLRSDYIKENEYVICSRCKENLSMELSDPSEVAYRALRPDEDVDEGLRPQDPDANLSLEDHVLHGSQVPSQFISFSWSLEVAMFYAIKGFIERGDRPVRVALACMPIYGSKGVYEVADYVGSFRNFTARNFGRTFSEICVENQTVPVFRVLVLPEASLLEFFDESDTHSFRSFQTRYRMSPLPVMSLERTVTAEVDLVGLQHYDRPEELANIRLFLEDENEFDQNAVAVDGQGNSDRSHWVRIGYLSREHAKVVRRFLAHTNGLYQKELPSFDGITYETSLKLHF